MEDKTTASYLLTQEMGSGVVGELEHLQELRKRPCAMPSSSLQFLELQFMVCRIDSIRVSSAFCEHSAYQGFSLEHSPLDLFFRCSTLWPEQSISLVTLKPFMHLQMWYKSGIRYTWVSISGGLST